MNDLHVIEAFAQASSSQRDYFSGPMPACLMTRPQISTSADTLGSVGPALVTERRQPSMNARIGERGNGIGVQDRRRAPSLEPSVEAQTYLALDTHRLISRREAQSRPNAHVRSSVIPSPPLHLRASVEASCQYWLLRRVGVHQGTGWPIERGDVLLSRKRSHRRVDQSFLRSGARPHQCSSRPRPLFTTTDY